MEDPIQPASGQAPAEPSKPESLADMFEEGISAEERRERLRDYTRIMIDVWKNLAVDDDAWERYCKLKGLDPKTAERPVDPFPPLRDGFAE